MSFPDDFGNDFFPAHYDFYYNFFNAKGDGERSMRQYFWESSFGQLDVYSPIYPLPSSLGSIRAYGAPYPLLYYLDNYDQNNPIIFHTLLLDAIEYVHIELDQIPSNLVIDSNGDGYVDNINFMIRGGTTPSSFPIGMPFWPHQGWLDEYEVYIHGKQVNVYNLNMEYYTFGYWNNTWPDYHYDIEKDERAGAGIGVLSHEFGHSLGMPDMYHRHHHNVVGKPIWKWDIMAHTTNPPQSISSYMKWHYTKWIDDLPIITETGTYYLNPLTEPLTTYPRGYIILSPFSVEEFFVVEYRSNTENFVDSSLPGSGLLIYRARPSVSGNYYSPPYELYVYREGGSISSDGYPDNAYFSLESGRTAISDATTNITTSFLSNGHIGGLNISNIGSALGNTISFTVMIAEPILEVFVKPGFSNPANHYYETINEAMNAVHTGGTVYLYPDIYTGVGNTEIVWGQSNITLTSKYPEDNPAIIDCAGTWGFRLENKDNQNKISYIEIRNASIGIEILGFSNPIIDNVIFRGNNPGIEGNSGIKIYNNYYGPFDIEVLVLNSEFIGFNNSGHAIDANIHNLTIINSIFRDNSGTSGSSIKFVGLRLHLEDCLFQNNTGTERGINIDILPRILFGDPGYKFIKIINCRFINNRYIGYVASILNSANISIVSNLNNWYNFIQVSECEFILDEVAAIFDEPSVSIINRGFSIIDYTNNTEIGFGNNLEGALFLDVGPLTVNIKNSIFTGRVYTTNSFNKSISNSWFFDVNNPSIPVDMSTMITGILPNNQNNIYTGNPHLDMTTFEPIFTARSKSGLINAGHLDTNGNGIPFWDDPEDRKFDGTNLDIGAVQNNRKQYVIQHDLNPDSEYIWLSFPYLDRLYGARGSIFPHSRLDHILNIQNENNLLSLNPRYIEYIEWKYEDSIGKVYYDDITNNWIGDLNHLIDSRHGYKIKLNSNVTYPRPLVTNGFYCGTTNNPQNQITISAREPGEDYREVWLGYYGLNLQDPFFVFDSIIDNLIQIKTQQWSLNRSIDLSIWALPANAVRLNFGEMVSIKYIGDEDATLYFPQMFSLEDMSRYHHPTPSHFTYIEQSDYIPIYVYLPDDLTEEGIGEIGLFINDICYGAEVIMGEIAQINAYIMDIDFDDADIEFQIMEYGSRSGEKRFENFEVFDHVVNEFRSTTLDLNNGEMFYVVSLKNANDVVDDLPKFTSLDGNFPNPFNPSTTIAYSLAESGNVKLQIFNIR
ncbi:MAG: hypothetical protein FWG98_14425, partial [Candidatus Cloacimonetes bacterium]|nr:hypothetical protein [Candidatus Cloacimonadota bacterium]